MENLDKAYQYAIKLLSIRRQTTAKIRQKLELKGFDFFIIEKAIEKLEEKKYLDDKKFAADYLEKRLESHPCGVLKLRAEMISKGFEESTLENCLNVIDYSAEKELAIKCAKTRYQNFQHLEQLEIKRLANLLNSRGFSEEIITELLESIETYEN